MTTETAAQNQADASTAFLRAARAGHLDKILNLINQDIDINVSNANGLNAIHLASKDGHVTVVSELLQRGAHIDSATKKGNTALHIASLAGQEAVVRLLVQNGAQVNIQSQNGFTPLYMAAQENHDGVVKFLLSSGANQSLATEDGFTPLAVAMQQGHEKVVAVLLEADTRGRIRLPALHIAAKKDDVKAATLLLEVSNEHNPDVTSKSGFTPLHIAAHYGNEAIARLLLAKGADVNFPAKHNICPLHVAAKWGKENMVMLLLERGANVESRTRDGLTPLHCAARSGHERVIEQLLEKGAPITSKSKNGLAPLHMAAQGDHAPALKALLGRRAAVDEVTADYLTALHVAAHCGHVKAAKLLLERGADADARALNGFTPLHIACKKNRIKVVELLLKHGASISATTESGLTPLHVASFMGCMNIVIYLLQHDAPPDAATVRGETPLHLAARANQTDIIRILLRNGAAVEARARERQTPLHVAARLGHADNVLLLLQHGAAPDAAASDRCSALHLAAKHHNHDVAQVLIENGAPLTATTKKGFTPLHLAAKYGNLKVANLLLQHGAPPDAAGKNGVTPLHVAAQYDQQQVATVLLEKGANAKAAAKNGHTPLHIAARKNQMETAGTLLEYGALPNAESKAGFTPLHLAAQQGHNEMCSLLVEHEADPNSQAKNGLTSLHLAAQEDRVPVAGIIVKNGAKVDVCTQGGYTPLHVASHFGQTNMVRFLLDSGALVQTKTCHGYTALHHAAQQGHINIVSLLLERGAESNATTNNGQTALDIAQKLGYVTVVETLKSASEAPMSPTAATAPSVTTDKYKVVAPETMLETFMSDSEEEGGEDTILTDQPYRYLTADDMKSLGDDSLPIDVTRDERAESIIGTKSIMDTSQGSNGPPYVIDELHTAKNMNHLYNTEIMKEGYCYNVDGNQPKRKLQWKNFLVSFLVDARGGAMRGNRGGGVKVIVPPLSAQQPTRITCRYLKASRINHMPPLMEGEALASRVLELGPVSAKFLGPIILEVPHYASLRGKEREIVILRSDNGTNWREHTLEASDEVVQDILNDTLEIDDPNEDSSNNGYNRTTRILTHDFPQYFAVISRIRQEVHAIGPEGGMVSSSVVPQVQAVFPQGALTKKIKVGLQAQSIDPELTAKLFGRGVAVSPVVTVEPRRRKFHKAITLSMPAPRPHSQGMINQYTSSAPTLRLLCSISGGTNRAHWEDVTENTPLTFVNDCVSFTTTVSARYWLIDCRNVADATKMATELYREAIHVPFIARFVVYARRMEQLQAQLRVFCVTDDREDKTLEKMERFTQVAKSRDVEVHEGKPCYLEFAGNMVPIVKTGEQHFVPFRAFRENRLAFNVMIKSLHADAVGRCQFMREPKVAKGEPSQTPVCALNIVIPEEIIPEDQPISIQPYDQRDLHIVNKSLAVEEQETIRQQRLHDPSLSDICNLLGKDWVALAYELGVSTATINQIQARKLTAAQQAELMLKLWKTQGGNKAQDNSLELALCRIGRDDIIAPQSNVEIERRIQRNIYQERQGSEEIEGYKLKSEKDKAIDDDHRIAEREDGEGRSEMEEAKYSPEEKSYIGESTERDPSISPSDDSEDDEAIKKSVAERKMQITRKLSQSKVPASKQKKELREEIIEIKKQINPEIKKFHIQQSTVAQVEIPRDTSSERLKSRLSQDSDATTPKEVKEVIKEVEKEVEKEVIKEEIAEEKTDKSPPRPGPKYMQKHIRNDSTIRFSSGDYSDVKIPAQKSPKDTGKKEDDFNVKSPDVVSEDKDVAEASLKDKIKTFEYKMDVTKTESVKVETKVKLTEEVLKRHTEIHDQATEYTKDFVRNQAIRPQSVEEPEYTMPKEEELAISPEIVMEEPTTPLLIKDQKMFKRFDRTDSTIVQFSSEDDSELLKKSTDSETETESQTTVRQQINKVEETISLEKKISKEKEEFAKKLIASAEQTCKDGDVFEKVEHSAVTSLRQAETGLRVDSSDDSLRVSSDEEMHAQADQMQTTSVGTTLTTSTKAQISDSISSDISKKSTSDALLDSKSPKLPLSGMEKADSLADLQQSTERDVSFISQTESKIYSKQTRSDSLDEASDLEDTQIPGAQKIPDLDMRKQTSQFIQWETQYASQDIAIKPPELPERKREDLSKVQLEEPRSDSLEESSELEDRRTLDSVRQQTADFLRWETQSSSEEYEVQPPDIPDRKVEDLKKEPVISAKARQFIETVPEDESVQECFFSKRIYSDSLEDSENHTSTDSRRASEPESLKSDRSDLSEHRTRPTSEFDELAELESAEIEGFGAKMYIPGSRTDSDDRDTSSGSSETRPRKVTKRHSRTESVSISQFSAADFKDEIAKATAAVQPEFQIIVTEAPDDERLSSFEKEELSDKISSESSREIEISDRKSSDDRISSEDAVTGKKSSSEEDIKKDEEKTPTAENIKDFKADSVTKKEIAISDTTFKRQSVTSTSSGTMDLGAAGKRPSDAHSLTESKDYTFEESEYSGGAHLAETKEKVEEHKEAVQIKAKDVVDPIIPTAAKSIPPKILHGDSLDDVEAFPDDHIIEHVSKMPGILETSTSETTAAISSIVCKESTTVTSTATSTTTKTTEKQESFVSDITLSTSVSLDQSSTPAEIIVEKTTNLIEKEAVTSSKVSAVTTDAKVTTKASVHDESKRRTYSVQSSPDDVEEKICTDSESDKAKVLEIIEPTSDQDLPIYSFDPKKIQTDSLDDADDLFPESHGTESEDFYAEYSLKTLQKQSSKDAKLAAVSPKVDIAPPRIDITRSETEERSEDSYDIDFDKKQAASEAAEAEKKKKEDEKEEVATKNEETIAKKEEESTTKDDITIKKEVEAERKGEEAKKEEETSIKKYETKTGKYTPKDNADEDKEDERSPDFSPEEDREKILSEFKTLNRADRRCSDFLEEISQTQSQTQAQTQGSLVRIDTSHVARDLSLKFSKTPPPSPIDLVSKDKVKVEAGVEALGQQPKSPIDLTRASGSSAKDNKGSTPSDTASQQNVFLKEAAKALDAAAAPKSPTRHNADNLAFVNVDQPTLTSGAKELVDKTIEKGLIVVDKIKQEMSAVESERIQNQFQLISGVDVDVPKAQVSFSTVLTQKESETHSKSGSESFTETRHVSSSDDDSLIVSKVEQTIEIKGVEHRKTEKESMVKIGDKTEFEKSTIEKGQEAAAKRSDTETKTTMKSSDDNDVTKVQREYQEQGLYAGRQTKSEERMSAIKDEIQTKKTEVKYSERDISHEQWGKEYFSEEGDDSYQESSVKVIEKDETIVKEDVLQDKGIVTTKTDHTKEESIVESKERDDLSSSSSTHTKQSDLLTDLSPKSRSKLFKKENEVYDVDFVKEIKVSTTRSASQESLSPLQQPQEPIQDHVWEVCLQQQDSLSETVSDLPLNQMAKSGESLKSLESHDAETMQKSLDSETLPEFSDSSKNKIKKEKSLEDICSSGYDTDLSSAEFQSKLESRSPQPFSDFSALEKTIDEVKQSLEAAQGEIINEKNDGTCKYKQSPSEFQFKLVSPDKPEVIQEEPTAVEEAPEEKKSFEISVSDQEIKVEVIEKDKDRDDDFMSDDDREVSQSGPHSLLETVTDVSESSPEAVRFRPVHKQIKSRIPVKSDRRSASDMEGWSSSGESHYQSFDSPKSRPLSSDADNLGHSTGEYESANTNQDMSSRSLRTSKEYYTAVSSLASRESMKSLDSESSGHLASIDISDASETLVPSASELKEELLESGNFSEQFEIERMESKASHVSDESPDEDVGDTGDADELVGKMKRSHEMRFGAMSESTDVETETIIEAKTEGILYSPRRAASPRVERTEIDLDSLNDDIISRDSLEYQRITQTESFAIGSKQSSTSSVKDQLSTPLTPISIPSHSSESTDNGREYVLDDMYEISEGPELFQTITDSKSEISVTMEERTIYETQDEKGHESPVSDEFEMVDKPGEIDDFVVIEEVAREATETDTEGKSVCIQKQTFEKKHDDDVERYLSQATKKDKEAAYSTSSSLSEEEMAAFEAEQKRLRVAENAEIEAGRKWIQMQFEGDARYDYERVPLEDIKEEEMTDFDASRIGSLTSQKESVGSYGSIKNSFGSLSESEILLRKRYAAKTGEQDDMSVSSLQEFENLEKALMEQYQQHSSSSQDSLNGSLPKRYHRSKSGQGDDLSMASLKEFEGLEHACVEALTIEMTAKQKEALLAQDCKESSASFLDLERKLYSTESSPPQKSGSPGQKSGKSSPGQKSSSSPSLKSGSPGQKYGSPSQRAIAEAAAIKKLVDEQMEAEKPKITYAVQKKYDDRGAFFVPEKAPEDKKECEEGICMKKTSYHCTDSDEAPGDCEEMMKQLEREELEAKRAADSPRKDIIGGRTIEVVRTTKTIQQKFKDGKKVSETVSEGVDIPGARATDDFESGSRRSLIESDLSSSITSQQSDTGSLVTMLERPMDYDSGPSSYERSTVTRTVVSTTRHVSSFDKPTDLDLKTTDVTIRELSPGSGKSVSQTTTTASGKCGDHSSWSGHEEDMSSSGSFSRGQKELMLGSTDSLEATSSNATRATYNYEVDTGSLTGSFTSAGSNTMVSSLDNMDPLTAFHIGEDGEQQFLDYEVQEADDSDTEKAPPRTKERTIMFESTETLSGLSGEHSSSFKSDDTILRADGSTTFFIGDTPIVKAAPGTSRDDPPRSLEGLHSLSSSLSPPKPSPVPAQRKSLTGLSPKPFILHEEPPKKDADKKDHSNV